MLAAAALAPRLKNLRVLLGGYVLNPIKRLHGMKLVTSHIREGTLNRRATKEGGACA